jgi:hypothetical protein
MRTFKVYKHAAKGLEAVKVGFSWPGFLFGVIWMWWKNLWMKSLLWIGLYIVLGAIKTVTNESEESGAQALVYIMLWAGYWAMNLIPGFKGNQWREANLVKRGYELVGEARTATSDAAVAQVVKTA